MNVAFLKAPIGGILGLEMLTFVEPFGLICVAGGLEEAGHRCSLHDLRIDGEERGLADCRRFDPDIVGLQCNFTTERRRALRLAQRVQREMPGAFVVMGGHDASREPEWFSDSSIDAIAVGDGEEIMPPLVDALERDRDLLGVPGLVLNGPSGQRATGHAPARRELDTLPMPARHLIRRYAPHYYINFGKPPALFETARGCPFKCDFCSVWKFHEATFREKSPARVVAELQAIEAPSIFITDDIFWMNVKRGEELAEAIQAAGIRKYFTVQTRTDIIHAILPTRMPLEEFYSEHAGPWRHVLETRYRIRGKARTYFALAGALATGKVDLASVKKGMSMAKVFSKPETFLAAHRKPAAGPLPA